jgi:hypothetical protein
MSGETGSSTERVYVRLLGEGTDVFIPAEAVFEGSNVGRLVAPADYDPDDQDWEFKPGALVRIESRTLEGKEERVAVALIR